MGSIGEIVYQALRTQYLSLEAENQLRCLLTHGCDLEDTRAFTRLQAAIVDGLVRQESRERFARLQRQKSAMLH